MYNVSDAFLRVRMINIEMKTIKNKVEFVCESIVLLLDTSVEKCLYL